jgi:hypothetical protein
LAAIGGRRLSQGIYALLLESAAFRRQASAHASQNLLYFLRTSGFIQSSH